MAAGEYKRGDLYCNLFCSKIYFAKLKYAIDFGEHIAYNEYIKRAEELKKIKEDKTMNYIYDSIPTANRLDTTLPALTGSEKQIKWASDIRSYVVNSVNELLDFAADDDEYKGDQYSGRDYKYVLKVAKAFLGTEAVAGLRAAIYHSDDDAAIFAQVDELLPLLNAEIAKTIRAAAWIDARYTLD